MGPVILFALFGLGFSAGICAAMGYHGAMLIAMLLLFFIVGFLVACLLFVLFISVLSLFSDKRKPQKEYNRLYAAVVTFTLGVICNFCRIRIHASGTEKVPEGRFLLVGNHRSGFDPIITGWTLRKHRLAFIAKPSVMKIPVVGRDIHKACYMAIDREDDRAALRTILAAIDFLKRDVTSIGIYPEGTRNTGDGLLPMRNGAFKIAQKAKVPIVICRVRGTENVVKNMPWRHTDVDLEVLEVMDAEEIGTLKTNEIGDKVVECITSADC